VVEGPLPNGSSKDVRDSDSGVPLEQAAGALRSALRVEMQQVLCSRKAAAQLSEIEGQVSRLLEKVSLPERQRRQSTVREAGASAQEVGSARRPSADGAVQTDVVVAGCDEALEETPLRPPSPQPMPRPRRSLIVKGEGPMANMLRTQVADARRRLLGLDREVTRLTAELKKCRSNVWNQQRRQCSTEAHVTKVLQDRADELPLEARQEEVRLQRQERDLAQELSKARALAGRESSLAKRQDTMLQQERDQQKGDAQTILAKHPAGEVFLPSFPPDTDSDDGNEMEMTRKPTHRAAASSGNEDVSLGTSDEEEDVFKGDRGRPTALRTTIGLESEKDDESLSGGSSMPSPSGESLNSKSPVGEAANRGRMSGASGSGEPAGLVARSTVNIGRAVQAATSESECTSDDEATQPPVRSGLSMASLAAKTLLESTHKQGGEAQAVPPLPGLSGVVSRGGHALPADEAEEITDEEEFEAETSRSGE